MSLMLGMMTCLLLATEAAFRHDREALFVYAHMMAFMHILSVSYALRYSFDALVYLHQLAWVR